jgi:hypothetical protein
MSHERIEVSVDEAFEAGALALPRRAARLRVRAADQ